MWLVSSTEIWHLKPLASHYYQKELHSQTSYLGRWQVADSRSGARNFRLFHSKGLLLPINAVTTVQNILECSYGKLIHSKFIDVKTLLCQGPEVRGLMFGSKFGLDTLLPSPFIWDLHAWAVSSELAVHNSHITLGHWAKVAVVRPLLYYYCAVWALYNCIYHTLYISEVCSVEIEARTHSR